MRISTNNMFSAGTSQLGTLQSQLARLQSQLSTNRRVLTPSDDPVASARALEVTQSQSINTQFATNRNSARSALSHEEMALDSTTALLQDVHELVVKAGNGAYSEADRNSLAVELQGRFDDLLGLANTADGEGGYVFSGYMSTTVPYAKTATGAQYFGDQGRRQLQVGSTRQIAVSDPGSAVFESGLSGNGTFETSVGATNTGDAVASIGSVSSASALTGDTYQLAFVNFGAPAVLSYTITDQSTGLAVPPPPAVATPLPYQSGKPIVFDGIQFDIQGTPAIGDTFAVAPSRRQSVFDKMSDLLTALRSPAVGAAAQAKLGRDLASANRDIGTALDSVLSVRASIGARVKELDYLDSAGTDIDVQYSTTLSQLQDLDVYKATSDFVQQKAALEAAQQTFKSLSGLSLFNFLR
jgi:flagellar hook-associated protein 3 FlgL